MSSASCARASTEREASTKWREKTRQISSLSTLVRRPAATRSSATKRSASVIRRLLALDEPNGIQVDQVGVLLIDDQMHVARARVLPTVQAHDVAERGQGPYV